MVLKQFYWARKEQYYTYPSRPKEAPKEKTHCFMPIEWVNMQHIIQIIFISNAK